MPGLYVKTWKKKKKKRANSKALQHGKQDKPYTVISLRNDIATTKQALPNFYLSEKKRNNKNCNAIIYARKDYF